MDLLKLYMPMTTPPSAGMSTTSSSIGWWADASVGCQEIVTLPAPGTSTLVALYWPPMMIGLVQPGTRRGMLLMTIGSRKIVPPRMLRIVPLGEGHIFFRPNSTTRASSGVIVAHLTPTPYFLIAFAESTVIWSSVSSRFWIDRS